MASDLTDATRRLVLSRIRAVMIGVGALAGLLIAGTWMIDEGEIVKITTLDDQEREQETELWIVDLPTGSYLRSGQADTGWLARLRANPKIVLERDEMLRDCVAQAIDSPAIAAEVAREMAEKYGFADRLWDAVTDRSSAVPVQVASCDGSVPAH